MKKTLLAGVTKDNELYFLNIDTTNNKRNGYNEFTISGETVIPIELEDAKEQSYQATKELVEQETDNISGLYLRSLDDIVEDIITVDGNLSGIDTSLYPNDIEVNGDTYIFISGSSGQHKEKELKHYFIDKKLFDLVMKIWEKYHMKELPQGNDHSIIEEAMAIKQDTEKLLIEAINIIN